MNPTITQHKMGEIINEIFRVEPDEGGNPRIVLTKGLACKPLVTLADLTVATGADMRTIKIGVLSGQIPVFTTQDGILTVNLNQMLPQAIHCFGESNNRVHQELA